ncbi:MAG: hypothetical protein MJ110_06735 [Lachnospiraceae bacterium]|nr:hypothetical protein [Lachnospiraceae bacterium]
MTVSRLFSDNLILQRDKKNLVYGTANPLENITVSLCENDKELWSASCAADAEGNWELEINPFSLKGVYSIVITGKDEKITANNVRFGDVYLLGGQSNMELTINMMPDTNAKALRYEKNDDIRMFNVPHVYDFSGKSVPISDGAWTSACPESIGEFSAIGYYFAKEKYENDGVPVGLVHTAVGGAPVESFMSEENLLKQAKVIRDTVDVKGECDKNKNMGCIFCYEELLNKNKQPGYIETTEKEDLKRGEEWHKSLDASDPGLKDEWMKSQWTTDFDTISFPRYLKDTKWEKHFGTLWLQKTVNVPKEYAGRDAMLYLGTMVDFDFTYVNGEYVGTTEYRYLQSRYYVKAGLLKEGENTITIRLGMDANVGGLLPEMPYKLSVYKDTSEDALRGALDSEYYEWEQEISGEWKVREGAKCEALEGPTFFIWNPTALYNTMISPLRGLSFDAVLFYQGESNSGRPEYYDILFKAMTDEWRSLFNNDLPFYTAEVAKYLGDGPVLSEDVYAGIRAVQHKCADEIDGVYLIPTTSLPAIPTELHPQNKKDVAHLFYEAFKENK